MAAVNDLESSPQPLSNHSAPSPGCGCTFPVQRSPRDDASSSPPPVGRLSQQHLRRALTLPQLHPPWNMAWQRGSDQQIGWFIATPAPADYPPNVQLSFSGNEM